MLCTCGEIEDVSVINDVWYIIGQRQGILTRETLDDDIEATVDI